MQAISRSTSVTIGILLACVSGAYLTGAKVTENRKLIDRNHEVSERIRERVAKIESIAESQREISVKLTVMAENSERRIDLIETLIHRLEQK